MHQTMPPPGKWKAMRRQNQQTLQSLQEIRASGEGDGDKEAPADPERLQQSTASPWTQAEDDEIDVSYKDCDHPMRHHFVLLIFRSLGIRKAIIFLGAMRTHAGLMFLRDLVAEMLIGRKGFQVHEHFVEDKERT